MNTPAKSNFDKEFILGVKDASPICIAFLFMCFSFGGLAKNSGMSLLQAMSMAMMIYSMPLQIFLMSLTKNDLVLSTIVALTFVANARFFLMSMSLMHRFKRLSLKKTIPALLILSASSFTVSHVKFLNDKLNKPFNYYLGVALSSYIVTFFSTLIGFYVAFVHHSFVINHVFSISLAIHFTALTAMRFPNFRLIISTFFGLISIPLLAPFFSLNTNLLISPFISSIIMLLTKKRDKS